MKIYFTEKDVKVISVTNKRFWSAREFDNLITLKLGEGFNNTYNEGPI